MVRRCKTFRAYLLFDTQNVRRLPSKMLSAVDTKKLSGNCWRIQYIAKGRCDILHVCTTFQNRAGALACELFRGLARAL